jgi:hypothetical protein
LKAAAIPSELAAACRLADDYLPVGGQGDIAWKGLAAERDAFGAGNDDRASAAQDGCRRVGCAKINSDDRHGKTSLTGSTGLSIA